MSLWQVILILLAQSPTEASENLPPPLAADMSLVACDELDMNNVGYSYFHESLGHKSLIDHVFVSKALKFLVSEYRIVNDTSKLSDPLPIQFHLLLPCSVKTPIPHVKKCVKEFR